MTRLPRRILLLAVALSLTACEEEMITLDSGTPSSLSVRVYVDANGNGVFDSGSDVPISATVDAVGDAGQASETTDGSGLATFSGLAPGSYELSSAGAPPSGSVLATASSPVVVAPFQGDALAEEFRYSFLPGDISGAVYRDDDESGVFELEEDTPAAGLTVALFSGLTTSGSAVATTTTNGDGEYSFEGLRPGSYTIELTPFETIEIVDGNTRTVTVSADDVATVDIPFTGSLVVSVAEARAAAGGSTVTVEVTITWKPGFDTRQYFFQDATGGMSSFDTNRPDIVEGELIRMTGRRGGFRGELQISPVLNIESLGIPGVPAPRNVTGAQINAGEFQGELVRVHGTVADVAVLSFGNQRVTMVDAAGTEISIAVDSRTGVTDTIWTVDQLYSVTGVIGNDDRNTPAAQVEVRSLDDVVEAISVAEARTMEGETVLIDAVATWHPSFDTRQFFYQDETGGMSAFDGSRPEFDSGDNIRISGRVTSFRGEVQISPDFVTVSGPVGEPTPRSVTAAEINGGQFQAELVTISGTVVTIDVQSFGNQDVTLTDGAGTEFHVRADSRTGVTADAWTEGQTFQVIGVIGNDNRNDPEARVEVRQPSDVQQTS